MGKLRKLKKLKKLVYEIYEYVADETGGSDTIEERYDELDKHFEGLKTELKKLKKSYEIARDMEPTKSKEEYDDYINKLYKNIKKRKKIERQIAKRLIKVEETKE